MRITRSQSLTMAQKKTVKRIKSTIKNERKMWTNPLIMKTKSSTTHPGDGWIEVPKKEVRSMIHKMQSAKSPEARSRVFKQWHSRKLSLSKMTSKKLHPLHSKGKRSRRSLKPRRLKLKGGGKKSSEEKGRKKGGGSSTKGSSTKNSTRKSKQVKEMYAKLHKRLENRR